MKENKNYDIILEYCQWSLKHFLIMIIMLDFIYKFYKSSYNV